jgi:uncharacterized membrane protein YfcA
MESAAILILGFFVGIFSSLFGVGGGILIVPFLPMITFMNAREVIATSLFTIFLVSLNNTISFHRQKSVDWGVSLRVGPLTALGSFLAAYLTRWMPTSWLKFILGTILILFVWQGQKETVTTIRRGSRKIHLLIIGLMGGVASGISGLGSGIIVSPLLMGLKLVDHRRVTPTTNAVMIFTTFFGSMAFIDWPHGEDFLRWGMVHGDMALKLFAGAWISGLAARRIQQRIPERPRRIILLSVLLGLALKVFWDAYQS